MVTTMQRRMVSSFHQIREVLCCCFCCFSLLGTPKHELVVEMSLQRVWLFLSLFWDAQIATSAMAILAQQASTPEKSVAFRNFFAEIVEASASASKPSFVRQHTRVLSLFPPPNGLLFLGVRVSKHECSCCEVEKKETHLLTTSSPDSPAGVVLDTDLLGFLIRLAWQVGSIRGVTDVFTRFRGMEVSTIAENQKQAVSAFWRGIFSDSEHQVLFASPLSAHRPHPTTATVSS